MFPPSGSMTVRPLLVLLATLVLTAVAHPHHDKVSDEDAQAPIDSILWIHVALQALVWGIIFPIGMVLGLTRSRWHVPLQVRYSGIFLSFIHFLTVCWFPPHIWRLHPRSLASRPRFSPDSTRKICFYHGHSDYCPTLRRYLPQTTHSRTNNTALLRYRSWNHREDVSCHRMGADAFWIFCNAWILSRGNSW